MVFSSGCEIVSKWICVQAQFFCAGLLYICRQARCFRARFRAKWAPKLLQMLGWSAGAVFSRLESSRSGRTPAQHFRQNICRDIYIYNYIWEYTCVEAHTADRSRSQIEHILDPDLMSKVILEIENLGPNVIPHHAP